MRKHWVRTDSKVEDEIPIALCPKITAEPKKFDLYTLESTFRQGWRDLSETSGHQWLTDHTFIILKPDCFAGRKHEIITSFLQLHDFTPVGYHSFLQTRNSVSEMWRYQWNSVPVDRSLVSTKLNCTSESALLVLRDISKSRLPASVRLAALKGNAQRFLRESNTLRWALDCINPMIGYVHTPDEPADVLRELSILFSSEHRRTIMKNCEPMTWDAILMRADLMARSAHSHDFNFYNSRDRLARQSKYPNELLIYIDSCFANLGMSWRKLLDLSGKISEGEAGWDEVVVAAYCIFQNYDIPGLLEFPGTESWRAYPR